MGPRPGRHSVCGTCSYSSTGLHDLAARCARGLPVISAAPLIRGRRESRMRAAPAVSWANCTNKTPTSIQVQRRQSDFPCAMVLTAASCSPRRSGFLVTVISSVLTADLTPASRRQDHTTWHVRNKSAFVLSAPLRPPHPHPAYATIMIRPSDGVGCESYSSILDSEKQKYFYQGSLTRHNCKGEVICPTGQISLR
jgi:hypothetical protein